MLRTLAAAAALMALALAGCTAPATNAAVDMVVAATDDPRSEPMRFEATGDADAFSWDFGDGTPHQEGRVVEHLWGFTDGIVQVRLTACTGGDCTTTVRSIDLGGARNVPPKGHLAISTDWDATGQVITLSARGSTDANGDPILYRWTCTRLADLEPAVETPHPVPGLPFGVNFAAVVDPMTAGDGPAVDASTYCDGEPNDGFTRTDIIHLNLDRTGLYRVEVEVKDPKSAAFVGRADLYASAEHPGANAQRSFEGDIPVAAANTVDPFCDELSEPGLNCPISGVVEHRFQLPICIAHARIDFTSDGGAASGSWVLSTAAGTKLAEGVDGEALLGPSDLCHGREYVVQVQADGPTNTLEYSWELDAVNDLNPRHLYKEPGH